MNSFKHGLSAIAKNRQTGALTVRGSRIKLQIRNGLIKDKGGDDKISTAEKVLVELISDDVAWLVTINGAIKKVLKLNLKAKGNPKALKQLDDYKRPIINSLTANLQKYGFEKIAMPRDIYDWQTREKDGEGDDETVDEVSEALRENTQ